MRSRVTYLPHFRGNVDIALHAQQNRAVVPQKGALFPSAAAVQLEVGRVGGCWHGRGSSSSSTCIISSAAHGAGRSAVGGSSGSRTRVVGHSCRVRVGERERVVEGDVRDRESTIVAMDSGSRNEVSAARASLVTAGIRRANATKGTKSSPSFAVLGLTEKRLERPAADKDDPRTRLDRVWDRPGKRTATQRLVKWRRQVPLGTGM